MLNEQKVETLKYLLVGTAIVLVGVCITLIIRLRLMNIPVLQSVEQVFSPKTPKVQTHASVGPIPSIARVTHPDYTLPPIQNDMVPVISSVATQQPVVFLTIDDGIVTNPNDAETMQQDNVKATFFLVQRFINKNPGFFSTLAQQTGSDIQNHSYDHYLLTNLTYNKQKEDICKNADQFADWYGRRPVLFRPSGGAYNDDTRRAAAACGMKALIMWNASINNGVLKSQHGSLRAGDIVLMHFRATFDEDLRAFATAAQKAGLEPALLAAWLN